MADRGEAQRLSIVVNTDVVNESVSEYKRVLANLRALLQTKDEENERLRNELALKEKTIKQLNETISSLQGKPSSPWVSKKQRSSSYIESPEQNMVPIMVERVKLKPEDVEETHDPDDALLTPRTRGQPPHLAKSGSNIQISSTRNKSIDADRPEISASGLQGSSGSSVSGSRSKTGDNTAQSTTPVKSPRLPVLSAVAIVTTAKVSTHSAPQLKEKEKEKEEVEEQEGALVVNELVLHSKGFKLELRGGTLKKIIQHSTSSAIDSGDANSIIDTFLLTYNSFVSPSGLLDILIDCYTNSNTNPSNSSTIEIISEDTIKITRLRLGSFLKRWLSVHFNDFSDNPQVLEKLEKFIKAQIASDPELDKLKTALIREIKKQAALSNQDQQRYIPLNAPEPIIPKGTQFMDFDPIEVARQLCLYEQSLYRKIHPKELLKQSWNKNPQEAPNITKFIDHFNNVSAWVASFILSTQDIRDRVEIIKRIIMIAVKCVEYHNFNGCQEMLGGLGGSGVGRLKKTWMKLKKKFPKLHEHYMACQQLMNAEGNFRAYRQNIATLSPPCLPYIGLYLKDLTFIEDGNVDYLKTKCKRADIINFEKMEMMASVIKDIRMFQQSPYLFVGVDPIIKFWENLVTSGVNILSDKDAYRISLDLEPRDTEVV